jgi:hypothetical protein
MIKDIRQLLFNKATRKMELLTTPVNRLGLELKRSPLQPHIDRLMGLLQHRGVRLKPRFYLGEDWGCVTGASNIEVGFYDADPLLKELNQDIRGWSHEPRVIDYLLRHETGHAFCYMHRLYKLREFRVVFDVKGKFFDTYPATDRFKPHPWSRDYVNPNRDHYAQKHPDEDFAETFGVWLEPRSVWRRAYRNKKGALHKLDFVTRLIARYGDKTPEVEFDPRKVDTPLESIKATVAEQLGASLTKYRAKATGYIDPLLKRIGRYHARPVPVGSVGLAEAIASYREHIEDIVVRNADMTASQASFLLSKIQSRARVLHLYVPLPAIEEKIMEVAALASSLATRFSLTGTIRRSG